MWSRRHDGPDPNPGRRAYYLVSLTLGVVAWLPIGALTAFSVLLLEPWPLSLRQGPDTDYAGEVFQRSFGYAPDETVAELYGRNEWAGFGEHIITIKFRFTDEDVVSRIVGYRYLERLPDGEPVLPSVWEGPAWWPPPPALDSIEDVYRRSQSENSQAFVRMWVDWENQLVYFLDVDVA